MTSDFDPPGDLKDMNGIAGQREAWTRTLQHILDERIEYSGTKQFYNPITQPREGGSQRKAIWSAFPQALSNLYGPERALEVADESYDWTTLGVTASGAPFVVPYRKQAEYCEWKVERNPAGEILAVTFTCEVVEYWWSLAQGYPPRAWNGPPEPRPATTGSMSLVLDHYRQFVDPSIRVEDLLFKEDIFGFDDAGRLVQLFSRLDYNPWNRWNTHAGLVHLTMPNNALSGLLWLCAQATMPWTADTDFDAKRPPVNPDQVARLLRCAPLQQSECVRTKGPELLTNPLRVLSALWPAGDIKNVTDRSIVGVVGPLARAGMAIAVDQRPHVHMQKLDTRTWRTPNGSEPQDFWTLKRGSSELGVRGEFRVPESQGFNVSKIEIDGVPIRYGGQIAQYLHLGFGFTAHDDRIPQPASPPMYGEPALSITDRLVTVDPADKLYTRLYPAHPNSKPVEPVLEDDEIQGNILAGFNKDHLWLVGLNIRDCDKAKNWLRQQAGKLATTAAVAKHNAEYKAAGSGRGKKPLMSWFNLVFSHTGLEKLGLIPQAARREERLSRAFQDGMSQRGFKARTDTVESPLPAEPHILAIIASDLTFDKDPKNGPERFLGPLEKIAGAVAARGFELVYVHEGTNNRDSKEPFGFRDGVSQPAVRGTLRSNQEPLARREGAWRGESSHDEPEYARPGQMLVWPGEFVLGYERQSPVHPTRPAAARSFAPRWARNGSFLVYARFVQHVDKFKEHLTQHENPELAAARLVGRWPNGAPLAVYPDGPPDAQQHDDNHFLFADKIERIPGDPGGIRCPFTAHIRKVNPRDEAADDEGLIGTLRRRILRRGMPFKRTTGSRKETGLLFLCYQASIEDQFEFIWRNWVNDGLRPAGGGVDALIHEGSEFVELREGGYFFSPAVSVIRSL